MALIQFTYVSGLLERAVPVQVILPADKLSPQGEFLPLKKYKTLYLLNGYLGCHTDWVSGTRIQRWAEERDLAVVMPSGENSFYLDRPGDRLAYGQWRGEERVQSTRRMVPLADNREDTFIGGLSMGGFGAIRNGLKYADTFSRIVALSSALHVFEGDPELFGAFLCKDPEKEWKQVVESDANPRWLVENLKGEKPGIYLACGRQDELFRYTEQFHGVLNKAGFDHHYVADEGKHDWDYWDRHIRLALDWLPLDERTGGLNSGNIRGE